MPKNQDRPTLISAMGKQMMNFTSKYDYTMYKILLFQNNPVTLRCKYRYETKVKTTN